MAEINDYLNSLNEAMAIHAQNAIKSLQFNKTELCTIVNETRAEQNIYIVSNGSTKYEVYSTGDIKYHINDRVYVNIPNNDFSQKKYIIGPYVENNAENLLYTSKFANIIESETNLAELATSAVELSEDQFEYGVYKFSVDKELKEIELLVPESEIEGLNKGYKYLAISADIKTDFENIPIKMGDYGIKVIITYEKKPETLKEVIEYTKVYALENRDMIGDVYNFRTYFNQKWLYELEKEGAVIKEIKIILYVGNNFKTYDNEQYISSNEDFINIYIANLSIRLGDPSAKSADIIEIYTNNGETYDSRSNTSQNVKEIHLKWQDYDDENEITYNYNEEDKAKNVKIHWYNDKVHSVGEDTIFLTNDIWEEYKENSTKENFNKVVEYYKLEKDKHYTENNITVAGERWIETQVRLGKNNSQISDTLAGVGWSLIEGDNFKKWSIAFNPDITKNNCKVKAIITDENDEIIGQSNELEFKNTIQVADPATVAKVAGLKIKADKDGNYPIYSGNTGEILSKSEIRDREMSLELKDPISNENYFTKNEVIIWKIPKSFSMIQMNSSFLGDDEKSSTELKELIPEQLKDSTGTLFNDEDNFYYIYRNNQEEIPKQKYRVENFYNKLKTNNIIFAYVIKNNILYEANKTFTFSQYGTSGSEYTFYLGLGNIVEENIEKPKKAILTINKPNRKHLIDCILFNNLGEEIISGVTIKLKWYKKPTGLSGLGDNDKINGKYYIYTNNNNNINNYKGAIIEASANYSGINFSQYLAIPVGNNDNIMYYDGPDKIIYDNTGGSPSQWTKPLEIYINKGTLVNKNFNAEVPANQVSYITIENNNKTFKTSPMYYISSNNPQYNIINGSGQYSINKNGKEEKVNINITCPVLIIQNKYQMPIINEWDGTYTVDEKKGNVLATMFGAGTKNGDNLFTGVIMGKSQEGIKNTQTNEINFSDQKWGLFGYKNGVRTFSLDVNGKLILGASGTGQIIFDSSNEKTGIIQSANYGPGGNGLKINLTDGQIDSYGTFILNAKEGSFIKFTDNNNSNNYIEIGLNNNGPYINSSLFKLGKYTNQIGGITITKDGLFSNNGKGDYFQITNNGISGLGWSIGDKGIYINDGYDGSVVTDADEKIRGLKTSLLDYIDRRINVGTISKSFNNLLLTPNLGTSPRIHAFPKLTYEGRIGSDWREAPIWWPPDVEWTAPSNAEDALFDFFAHNFIIKSIDHNITKNIKDFIEWVIENRFGGNDFINPSDAQPKIPVEENRNYYNEHGTFDPRYNSEMERKYPLSAYIFQGGTWGNCTAAAWMLIYHTYGIQLPGRLGNGGDWVKNITNQAIMDDAHLNAWIPSTKPTAGGIVSIKRNGYGHVAFIPKILTPPESYDETPADKIHYECWEGNYNPPSGTTGGRAMILADITASYWTGATSIEYAYPPDHLIKE